MARASFDELRVDYDALIFLAYVGLAVRFSPGLQRPQAFGRVLITQEDREYVEADFDFGCGAGSCFWRLQ